MRWPTPGEQANKNQVDTQAEIRARKQQRAEKRRQSRWGWLTDPQNLWLVLVGAVAAAILAGIFGGG